MIGRFYLLLMNLRQILIEIRYLNANTIDIRAHQSMDNLCRDQHLCVFISIAYLESTIAFFSELEKEEGEKKNDSWPPPFSTESSPGLTSYVSGNTRVAIS